MSKIFTAISSGKFKGKKLELPSLSTTRSTKNIVKGSFFDTLRNELAGKIFIEGFGGSAVMACEALSNGAKKSYAVELDKSAYEATRLNAKNLSEDLEVFNADTFELTPRLIRDADSKAILYLDPPFDIRDGFEGIYQKCYKMVETLDDEKIFLIAIEHTSILNVPNLIGKFELIKTKKFGNTALSYYK